MLNSPEGIKKAKKVAEATASSSMMALDAYSSHVEEKRRVEEKQRKEDEQKKAKLKADESKSV